MRTELVIKESGKNGEFFSTFLWGIAPVDISNPRANLIAESVRCSERSPSGFEYLEGGTHQSWRFPGIPGVADSLAKVGDPIRKGFLIH